MDDLEREVAQLLERIPDNLEIDSDPERYYDEHYSLQPPFSRERLPEVRGGDALGPHDEGRHGGQIQGNDRLDRGARASRTTLPTSSWEGR